MSKETLILPIAGAGNFGKNRVSTAAAHFCLMSHDLRGIEGVGVLSPLVPPKFGVFGSLDEIYKRVQGAVEKVDQQHPDAQKIVVGHSCGGLLGRRLLMDGLVDGVVGIGSPQHGLNSIVPASIRHNYLDFAEATPDEAAPDTLALLGSNHDELVPIESSLAPLMNADLREIAGPMAHNWLVLAPRVRNLSTEIVRSMVGAETLAPVVDLTSLQQPA